MHVHRQNLQFKFLYHGYRVKVKVTGEKMLFSVLHISWFQAWWCVITGMIAASLPSIEKQPCFVTHFVESGVHCDRRTVSTLEAHQTQ